MPKVLLLGAGPTNLATADRLLRSGGCEVAILERLPWCGGLSKSYKHGPYTLDLGPHRFTPHNDTVYNYVKDLCGDDLKVVDQRVEIYLKGRFLKYPFSLPEVLRKLGLIQAFTIGSSFLAASFSNNAKEAAHYEDWIKQRFGSEILELVFRPLIGKVWGTPLDHLASRFAWQRIAISSLWEILWETIRGKRKEEYSSPYYPQNCFLYPKKGFSSIIDGMETRIRKNGGAIHLETTVEKIHCQGNRVTAVQARQGATLKTFAADWVISTLPINLFTGMMEPAVKETNVSNAAAALRFRRLILLYLVLKKERVSYNTSYYFPGPEFAFGRASEQKNHSPWCVPSQPNDPRTVFTVEIPCWQEDAAWKEPDASLFEKTITALEPTGIMRRQDVIDYFTVRLGYVYPVWDLNFESNLNTILDYLRPMDNLILNGRPGLFFYNNIHHSLEMGFVAADQILSGRPKNEKWEIDCRLFRQYKLVE